MTSQIEFVAHELTNIFDKDDASKKVLSETAASNAGQEGPAQNHKR